MRIRLTITPLNTGPSVLPVNYQYPLSAWIYKVISQGNHAFARFLHERGYGSGNKSFRLFTFSMLDFTQGRYRVFDDRVQFEGTAITMVVSFLIPAALDHFISGLFKNQQFTIGDRQSRASFLVSGVEVLPQTVISQEMSFRTLSPVLVSEQVEGRKNARYMVPDEEHFGKMIIGNLVNKLTAVAEADPDMSAPGAEHNITQNTNGFRLLSAPRKKGVIIKADTPQQTKIIGYLFDFEITAAITLIQVGYHAGFGEKNSLGFGCCEVLTR
jgi:CRISPR-associated endoribonuclease Cas6